MITAVDTNVLLDVLLPNPAFVEVSEAVLREESHRGRLVVCEIVYSELAAAFRDSTRLRDFLSEASIHLDSSRTATLESAGQHWRRYRAAGGKRERILADFLIGAHASQQCSQLLTRDRGFYRSHFTNLTVRCPTPQR